MEESNDIKTILESKDRTDLQFYVKKIGGKRYYKMTKPQLVAFLVNHDNQKKIKELLDLNIKKKFDKKYWFALIIPILLGSYWYSNAPSKDDLNSVINVIDKNEEYVNEIARLEKQNKKFLRKIMGDGYIIFGAKDGKLVTREILMNNLETHQYNSRMEYNYKEKWLKLELDYTEFVAGKGYGFIDSSHSKFLPIEEGKIMLANLVQIDPCHLFVLLKEDPEEPVFALGLGDCKHIDKTW